jgi:hypothetical protein
MIIIAVTRIVQVVDIEMIEETIEGEKKDAMDGDIVSQIVEGHLQVVDVEEHHLRFVEDHDLERPTNPKRQRFEIFESIVMNVEKQPSNS